MGEEETVSDKIETSSTEFSKKQKDMAKTYPWAHRDSIALGSESLLADRKGITSRSRARPHCHAVGSAQCVAAESDVTAAGGPRRGRGVPGEVVSRGRPRRREPGAGRACRSRGAGGSRGAFLILFLFEEEEVRRGFAAGEEVKKKKTFFLETLTSCSGGPRGPSVTRGASRSCRTN
jgi:hypothetical protein